MTLSSDKPFKNGVLRMEILSEGRPVGCIAYVASIQVMEAFGKLARASIVLDDGGFGDEDFKISDSDEFQIGKHLEIKVGNGDDPQTIFKGIVISQNIKLDEGSERLVVNARHEAIKMTRIRKFVCYENLSDADIVSQIASANGIAADVQPTGKVHESLIQYNSSDWDFVNLRAEANGQLLCCTPEGIVSKSPDVNASPVLQINNGINLISLNLEVDGRRSYDSYSAKSWNYCKQEIETESVSSGSFDAHQGNMSSAELSSCFGGGDYTVLYGGMQSDSDSIKEIVNSRMMLDGLQRIRGTVSFPGDSPLHPGDTVLFDQMGKRSNGTALVSAVLHKIDADLWTTEVQFGLDGNRYAERFDDICDRPAFGAVPSMNGLQLAVIEQLSGDPIGEDRIKISLLGGENASIWARLALLDAGDERGTFFIPEVGDEVIVGFINDDPNAAVILGVLHSSSRHVPSEINDDNNLKGIFTKSKIKLVFDDEKKAVTLETPGGNKIVVSDDSKGILLEDQNGNKITMDDNGITIESSKNLVLKAAQDFSAKGTNVSAEADASFKAAGKAGAELSTNGNAVLKGSIVQIN